MSPCFLCSFVFLPQKNKSYIVALGFVLLIVGWKMTGQLTGLALMLAGVVLLLTALMLYNKPFEEPK